MAWLNGNAIYSIAAIRKQARHKAKLARKRSKKEKQAEFDDQVQSAIAAGIPVTIIPYQGKPAYEDKPRRRDKIAQLEAEIADLKRKRWKERPKYVPGMDSEFYNTWEWRDLRWQVLTASNGKCKACNRGKDNGIILHVDHIKPRSKFPALELVFDNLQVLCEDCNIGKSNK